MKEELDISLFHGKQQLIPRGKHWKIKNKLPLVWYSLSLRSKIDIVKLT